MRVSGWKTIALAILMCGVPGGCGKEMIAELEGDLARSTKDRDECKAENVKLEESITRLRDEEQAAISTDETYIEKLKKEVEELKAQLAAK